MNMLKLTAAAALVAASLSASAMSSIADEDLSAVAGQDGVSIAANLNINIGSFTWGNNSDADGAKASVSFNKIQISGLVAMTIDVISGTQFTQLYNAFTTGSTGGTNTTLGYIGTQAANVAALAAAYTAATPTAAQTAAIGTYEAAGGTKAALLATAAAAPTAALFSVDSTATFYNKASDVVQFAFPNVKVADKNDLINISVNSITLGSNGATSTTNGSFGSFSINQLDLRGTTVWMWAH